MKIKKFPSIFFYVFLPSTKRCILCAFLFSDEKAWQSRVNWTTFSFSSLSHRLVLDKHGWRGTWQPRAADRAGRDREFGAQPDGVAEPSQQRLRRVQREAQPFVIRHHQSFVRPQAGGRRHHVSIPLRRRHERLHLPATFIRSYLVRPSPFSAQKTFERHNSRRKSNISFCSNINLAGNNAGSSNSRRGSGIGLNNMGGGQMQSGYPSPRAPPLVTTKSNSLSLPDSPSQAGQTRGRSNSLRVGPPAVV